MAIKPKQIIDTAVDAGKAAVTRGVEVAEQRLRGRKSTGPSGPPSTVGAARPGAAGAHKSGTATKRSKAKPKAKAKPKPRKPAKRRATAAKKT